MKRRRLGCLTTGGVIAMIIALLVVGVSYAFSGGKLFSPGKLNAETTGIEIGGVQSHADLTEDCAACHTAPWNAEKMTNRCLDCHAGVIEQLKDASSLHGAVMSGFKEINCRDCHTDHHGAEASLTEYLSGEFPHELVGFALNAHDQIDWEREVVCADCHQDSFRNFEQIVCQNCHEQVDALFMTEHTDLFGFDCMSCHDGYETYGKDFDHNAMLFPLEGKHAEVPCAQCHVDAISLADLQGVPTACEACHLEDDAHDGVMGTQCGVCHTPVDWTQASFDHSTTGFLLVGGHAGLTCENCHRDSTYLGADPACISCHAEDEPHNGQFGVDCAACHVVTSWDEIHFDHSGAYAQDCAACHTVDKPAGHYSGQCSACHSTAAWLPASFDHQVAGATDCLACHAGDKPANHFVGQCSQCHSTNAWTPASFSHTFPLNHGGANNQCSLCHTTSDYNAYTCYGCHEHTPSNIQNEHEGISNLNDCVRCHWDGREHDDDGGGDDD